MDKLTRKAMDAFAGGPAQVPKGVGPLTMNKLRSRRWVVRTERPFDYSPEFYCLTPEGRKAYLDEMSKKGDKG